MSRLFKSTVVAILLVVSGCAGPDDVRVPGTEPGTFTITEGATLVVELGEQNRSVGDSWYLVTPPDEGVLADQGDQYESDCDAPGCGGILTWHFDAVGTGTTDLVLRYCYRSRPSACEPADGRGPAGPVTLTVTVT